MRREFEKNREERVFKILAKYFEEALKMSKDYALRHRFRCVTMCCFSSTTINPCKH